MSRIINYYDDEMFHADFNTGRTIIGLSPRFYVPRTGKLHWSVGQGPPMTDTAGACGQNYPVGLVSKIAAVNPNLPEGFLFLRSEKGAKQCL